MYERSGHCTSVNNQPFRLNKIFVYINQTTKHTYTIPFNINNNNIYFIFYYYYYNYCFNTNHPIMNYIFVGIVRKQANEQFLVFKVQ